MVLQFIKYFTLYWIFNIIICNTFALTVTFKMISIPYLFLCSPINWMSLIYLDVTLRSASFEILIYEKL